MSSRGERAPEPWSAEDFRSIALALRAQRGAGLPEHRLGLIQARLQARLQARGVPSFTWFHDRMLRARPGGPEMQLLIDLSTINHSAFFREPVPLQFLAGRLAERLGAGAAPVRAWSAGCSAGQEPFSLAMAVAELVPAAAALERLQVWASDLSLEVVRAAARAIYEARDLAGVPAERLRRFFLRGRGPRRGSYRVAPEVRRLVTFQHLDLHAADWPVPADFDAILCRNVALYFAEAERLPLLERLAGRLRGGGWLAVGNCEILPGRPRGLEKVAPSLYRKAATP